MCGAVVCGAVYPVAQFNGSRHRTLSCFDFPFLDNDGLCRGGCSGRVVALFCLFFSV